jgi:hypothetical protein
MSANVTATLNYAGEIMGPARFDVVNPETSNFAVEPHRVTIRDVRSAGQMFGLDDAGFCFDRHESEVATNPGLFETLLDDPSSYGALARAYELDVATFLKDKTGAIQVFPQIGGLLARNSLRSKRPSWATPAEFVHLDFTPGSASQFLGWTRAALQLDPPRHRRMVIYQTWRALSKGPQDSTLAICDGRSVTSGEAIVCDSVIGPETAPASRFDIRLCRYEPDHRWYYLSDMEPDDLILFKGFDSDHPHAMNAMHSAFDNPLAGPDAEPRRSIEARFFAFF